MPVAELFVDNGEDVVTVNEISFDDVVFVDGNIVEVNKLVEDVVDVLSVNDVVLENDVLSEDVNVDVLLEVDELAVDVVDVLVESDILLIEAAEHGAAG